MKKQHLDPPARNPRYPPDAHVDGLFAIAEQIGRLADATLLLAQATTGEFDQEGEEVQLPSPTGKGMGMQG